MPNPCDDKQKAHDDAKEKLKNADRGLRDSAIKADSAANAFNDAYRNVTLGTLGGIAGGATGGAMAGAQLGGYVGGIVGAPGGPAVAPAAVIGSGAGGIIGGGMGAIGGGIGGYVTSDRALDDAETNHKLAENAYKDSNEEYDKAEAEEKKLCKELEECEDENYGQSQEDENGMSYEEGTINCPECGEEVMIGEFARPNAAGDGLDIECPYCETEFELADEN